MRELIEALDPLPGWKEVKNPNGSVTFISPSGLVRLTDTKRVHATRYQITMHAPYEVVVDGVLNVRDRSSWQEVADVSNMKTAIRYALSTEKTATSRAAQSTASA
ncbi:hypothetical protein UFOVP1382_79 [uncultured Caudovirales phage]|uniref:Uncharacterized protein n=1 Tax=uncultured Caudovirales phage TaxID=2100421 RepID=A0A6J5S0K6_9CAUD|nr:hypothetical protein UFOVP1382_79 [uncultured Caudovirales phage]